MPWCTRQRTITRTGAQKCCGPSRTDKAAKFKMAQKKSDEPTAKRPAGAATAAPSVEPTAPYVVLARKYRPETFDDLIGQQAMVTTLENAFKSDRIAQGYMLTGVRGVGKTTTARILARALNYSKPGLPDRPTVQMDGLGVHCAEIIASRHPDVVEMDAASNTGVDNMREIIESARYRPLMARTKVFIIDEVHMLSKGAFNALLKTLEEPPAHVKFIFATTEIRKVPVTVLSRCQRFDLRRVEIPQLSKHFARITTAEGATADAEALTLIARAAEGSVRDGLSILDQAIAMGSGNITADAVRAMLGLADRGLILDLLDDVLAGKTSSVLERFAALHQAGAEPVQVLADLADAVHITTRTKVAGEAGAGEALSIEEKKRSAALAGSLSLNLLTRCWQMLLKGIEEAARAPSPLAAAEMVLIRLCHTADLPTPDELIRTLGGAVPVGRGRARSTDERTELRPVPGPEPLPRAPLNAAPVEPAAAPPPAPVGQVVPVLNQISNPRSFNDVVDLVGGMRDAHLKLHLEDQVSLLRFEPGHIEIALLDGAPKGLAGELGEKLTKWTGQRWVVVVGRGEGEAPIGAVRRAAEAAQLADVKAHRAVAAVLSAFPEAEIKNVRSLKPKQKRAEQG
jgi:DNA polymerase III subunit gamma/tau